jgi:hypothetical protein
MILCFQLCGNSLGKALSCFSMTMPPCTKEGPYRNGVSRLVWKNLTGLHRALTSTPSNTIGMNWNVACEPGLIALHQYPNLTNAFVSEWKQVPSAMFQHLCHFSQFNTMSSYCLFAWQGSIVECNVYIDILVHSEVSTVPSETGRRQRCLEARNSRAWRRKQYPDNPEESSGGSYCHCPYHWNLHRWTSPGATGRYTELYYDIQHRHTGGYYNSSVGWGLVCQGQTGQ